jgi:hypothetical protein
MKGRDYRRRQMARAKQHALRLLRVMWDLPQDWLTARVIGKHAADRTPCSCSMCGNPRRHFGQATLQEQRADRYCTCEDAA